MLLEILVVIFIISMAGFFSAVEIAIASFGRNRIDELKEKKDKTAEAFESIQNDPNVFFGSVQVITAVLLSAAAILSFYIAVKYLSPVLINSKVIILEYNSIEISFLAALIFSSFFILVLGVLLPKAVGFKYSEGLAKSTVKLMLLINLVLKYPVKWITGLNNLIISAIKEKTDFSQTRFSEDEIRIIISEGVKTGAINETEHKIIENLFEFKDLHANEVMIPRIEMVAIEMNDDIQGNAKDILKINHSLIPVYVDTVDNIVGVIHSKDFMKSLLDEKSVSIKSLVRPAYFVPETKLISEILREMQNRGERLAIVTDEYGGTEGIITIEDILEEIVGDIWDNSKARIREYSKLPDGKYYVLGSMTVDDFNEIFTVKIPYSDEYNTVAGFVADKSGKILNSGEVLEYENLVFELIKKIRQKMVQFRVYSTNSLFTEAKEK